MKISNTLRLSASVAALLAASAVTVGTANAQDTQATQDPQAAHDDPTVVIVTGSHLKNINATSPTPVTSLSTEQLQSQSAISIQDAVLKAPQFTAVASAQSGNQDNGRGFNTPTPQFNLYGLGAVRTLVLLDGNRIAPSYYNGTTNIDMLPQMLVKRVDVVTGGASATYGSDAVAGVVNFILDHKFNGLKLEAQAGVSSYGDGESYRIGAAFGANVLNKGHFEASSEYYKAAAIEDSSSRPYGLSSCNWTGIGSQASPFTLSCDTKQSNTSPYGLIVTGPLAGQQFSADGKSFMPFNPGTPTGTGNTSIGGDGGVQSHEGLTPSNTTFQNYARFDYDVSDNLQLYAEGRYATITTEGASQGYTNTDGQYPLWIYSGNAFLTPAQQAALFPTGTNAVDIARFDNDMMRQLTIQQETTTTSFSVGAKGTAFGDFTWDAHYTNGANTVRLDTINNVNTAHLYAALDAVTDPDTGKIVCRASLVTPGAFPGCAPINMFGQNNQSQAALDYVFGTTGWTANTTMDDLAANLTGTAFQGWAGPIQVAVGAEYHTQSLNVTSTTPDATFDSQNLRLGATGTPSDYPGSNLAWFKEVQSPGRGSERVFESYAEVQVPLLTDAPMAKSLSVDGAYRYAHYDASGEGTKSKFDANTWKVGLQWAVNDDIRFRVLESQDIRAPTLYELYQKQEISTSGYTDPLTHVSGNVNTVVGGNPDLVPEVSRDFTAGVVFTPKFLPGLTASLDYVHIKIENAIGAVSGGDASINNLCQSTGAPQYCDLIVRPGAYNDPSPGNFPLEIKSVSSNVALNEVKAWTAEIDYRTRSFLGLPGKVDLHVYYTYTPVNDQESFPGAGVTHYAGLDQVWAPAPSKNVVNAMFQWSNDPVTVTINERYVEGGTQGPSCCNMPWGVYDKYKIDDYYQTDVNAVYAFDHGQKQAFVNISNLWNDKGPMTGGWTGSPGMLYPIPNYVSPIGRYITVGFRMKM